jgi:hypothetical protein
VQVVEVVSQVLHELVQRGQLVPDKYLPSSHDMQVEKVPEHVKQLFSHFLHSPSISVNPDKQVAQ